MWFPWSKRRSRARIRRESPIDPPDEFGDGHGGYQLWQYAALTPEQRDRLRANAAVFVAEKNWEGCGGVEMTDGMKRAIAAQMALVTLGFEEEYFDRVLSILVYPDAFWGKTQFSPGGGLVVEGHSERIGEAWHRGPVLLSWPDVEDAGRGPNRGRHLVAHEFAHQLDMLNGGNSDGVPVMESRAQAERWIDVVEAAYRRLVTACTHGLRPRLDCYGATSRSEFFAVASEAFFQTPQRLAAVEPELFACLVGFYGVDPGWWGGTGTINLQN